MQKCESRTKRVMSAIIAGMMALQVVAPTISYADDTVASTASSEDNSDTQIDPGVPVQTDTASSNTVTEPDSSESLEETTDSEQTGEIQDDTVSDSQGNETNTQEETVQDTVQQNNSGSETTESESVRTVTVTLNKNGGIFEPEWLETANEDPIAAYLGTETNDIAIEDTGDTIVATVTDRDNISIPVALSGDDSLYFTGWDVSSGSYDDDNETLTFDDGVDAYVLTAVYNSVADEDQQLIENKEIFDEQAEKNVLQQKLSASGISLYEMRPSDSYNQLDLIIDGLAFTSDDGLVQTFTAPYDGDYTITAYGANGGTGKGKYQGYRTPGRGGKAEGTIHLSAGQTIHIYLGEAGGYWSTNRTFGGGGGQIDWDRAWFPDEDNGQTDRYHVFGRGGGATYVTVDAWTMDQAGEAAHDYTDAEKAQNDAAAEVAKNHVILLAGGGGGMGESGGSAGGGGLEGQGPVANRYYAGGFPPYSNAFSYDATVGGTTPTNGRVLTYDERVDAKVYPATQTRAGFGYHYTILGELYDANPANRDPVSLLFDDGQARNYGSFLAKTVTKVWDDNNNQDGLRPNTLRVALTGTDGTYIEKSLSTANNWTETFDGLYKYFKEGTPIQYTIDEEMVGGYEKEISEKDNLITITNTHAPEKLDLIVNVVWNDANNQDGYRPDAATIHMSGTDGTQDTRDFTKSSSWTAIVFKDLDHYKDGNEIKYTVTEDEIPQYTTSIAVNGNVVTVTNTHIPEITLRNISVVWKDNNDQDGLRPDTVSVKLKGNDKFIDSSELNEDVEWKHSFTKLPVRENGNEITYTAEENEIPGYTTSIEKTDTGYVFTNTHIPETVTVTVDKVWKDAENQDGLRPDAIQIRLISNDIEKDAYLDAESDWHLDFEGLPKYRDHGILNEYSVQEVDVDGYTSTVTTKDGYAFTIENDHVPAVIDIPITEEWIDDNDRDGLRPDSHTVVLVDGTNAIEEVVLDKNNGYGVVLKNMPKYKNGVEINYQIKDFKVDGYTTNIIKSDSVKDFNITNTHVPEMVTVTVTEGWHDQSDYDKIRPEKVTLTLTGSDGNVYEKTVTKDTWTTAFSDLPKNSKGEQIIYTLTQEGIKGYKTTITDNETGTIAVINTHEPVKTITVTVTWNDENNKDNIRPDKVTVKLANGTTAVSTKEINNDSWKHVFENIIVFNGDGKASYTVTQDAVNGYTTEIKASDDGNTIEIINTHVPVAPPKEEPKQEETATPAAPAPVVEIKTEPTTTVIETPNKQTGISFMDGLFG